MQNLTDSKAIKKIDPQDTLGTTDKLLEQCEAAWNQVNAMTISQDFGEIDTIVFCGMGASIYGALVLKAMAGSSLRYPVESITDYHLPAYVDEKSLVVLTSYSGTTEEVLSCAQEAKEKNSKMLVLTKGGPLAEFARSNNVPSYIFDGALNPASVPRLGAGYTIVGLIGLLHKVDIIEINSQQMMDAIAYGKKRQSELKKKAMENAKIFVGKTPIIFAAEHLSGNAQIFRNQFNETSKAFSAYYLVPDLNHHLMEGLQFPQRTNLYFIMLNSSNYSPKIQRRMELTTEVIKQNNHALFELNSQGNTIYDDFIEVLVYGGYLTLYLALLHDQNPAVNPWVDYFKEKLARA